MSTSDVKALSSSTGSYPVLRVVKDEPAGKPAPETGKSVPVEAEKTPDLEALTAQLNRVSVAIGRDLRFKVDMNNGSSVIQVLDRETGEIIREIPPEDARLSVAVNGEIDMQLFDGSV